MEIGDDTQYRWLKGILAAAFILSVVDGVMTVFWIFSGYAREANVVMDYLLRLHPALFMTVKTTLVGLGLTLLWRLRTKPLAVIGIFMSFILFYAIVVGFHLYAAGLLVAYAQG